MKVAYYLSQAFFLDKILEDFGFQYSGSLSFFLNSSVFFTKMAEFFGKFLSYFEISLNFCTNINLFYLKWHKMCYFNLNMWYFHLFSFLKNANWVFFHLVSLKFLRYTQFFLPKGLSFLVAQFFRELSFFQTFKKKPVLTT